MRSPFGAALCGTRDQPRRMNALGYHVWMIRFWAFMFSGLLTSVAGILFIYYTEFISPQALALTASAEGLLMVISGGAGTLLGPVVGAALVVIVKNVVSAYITRWNFMLGAIFVAIVVFMPEGLVPGAVRLTRWPGARAGQGRRRKKQPHPPRGRSHDRARRRNLCKSFGGLRVTTNVNLSVAAGERRLIIGPNGAGKTTLVQSHHRRNHARLAARCSLFGRDITRTAEPQAQPISAWRAPIRSSRCLRSDTIERNVTLALLGLSPLRWNPFLALDRQRHLIAQARAALARVGLEHIAARPLAQTSYGERRRVEIAMALAQNPQAACCSTSRSPACRSTNGRTCASCLPPFRATSPSS